MDLKTFKIKHPETYQAAVAEGEAKEHDRVSAHLMCGQKFDAMPVALKAIKDKVGLTAELQDEYLSTATSRLERRARQLDSDEAGAILAGAQTTAEPRDFGDLVCDAMGLKPAAPAQAQAHTHTRPAAATPPDAGDLVCAAMGLSLP